LQPTKATFSMEAARNHSYKQRVYICNLIAWQPEKTLEENVGTGKGFGKEQRLKNHNNCKQITTANNHLNNKSQWSTLPKSKPLYLLNRCRIHLNHPLIQHHVTKTTNSQSHNNHGQRNAKQTCLKHIRIAKEP
jgi:hypothetical protein